MPVETRNSENLPVRKILARYPVGSAEEGVYRPNPFMWNPVTDHAQVWAQNPFSLWFRVAHVQIKGSTTLPMPDQSTNGGMLGIDGKFFLHL